MKARFFYSSVITKNIIQRSIFNPALCYPRTS